MVVQRVVFPGLEFLDRAQVMAHGEFSRVCVGFICENMPVNRLYAKLSSLCVCVCVWRSGLASCPRCVTMFSPSVPGIDLGTPRP